MAWVLKVLVSCYSWEVMRGKMLQRDTVALGGILEPVHYMHYIFSLQAHLNRIYQVWNTRGTEMYWSSVAKYASRFDKGKTPLKSNNPFYWKFPSCFLKTPRNDLISLWNWFNCCMLRKIAWKLHWSCDRKWFIDITRSDENLVNIVTRRNIISVSLLPDHFKLFITAWGCLDSSPALCVCHHHSAVDCLTFVSVSF